MVVSRCATSSLRTSTKVSLFKLHLIVLIIHGQTKIAIEVGYVACHTDTKGDVDRVRLRTAALARENKFHTHTKNR